MQAKPAGRNPAREMKLLDQTNIQVTPPNHLAIVEGCRPWAREFTLQQELQWVVGGVDPNRRPTSITVPAGAIPCRRTTGGEHLRRRPSAADDGRAYENRNRVVVLSAWLGNMASCEEGVGHSPSRASPALGQVCKTPGSCHSLALSIINQRTWYTEHLPTSTCCWCNPLPR